jgi:hypothetical protein
MKDPLALPGAAPAPAKSTAVPALRAPPTGSITLRDGSVLLPHPTPAQGMPDGLVFFLCAVAVVLFFKLLGFGRASQGKVEAERIEAERVRRADESWFEAERERAERFATGGAEHESAKADTLAKAEAVWHRASMRRAKAQRAKDEAEAAVSRAQWGLKRATEEWDSAILAAEWALKDYRDAEARKAAEAAPRDEEVIERIVGKIRALRVKTVSRGCSDAEARSAAHKAAQLIGELLKRGLTAEEIKRRCS